MTERPFEDLLRELAPQVLGALVRRYGHFDSSEDAVQEALLAAATQWPKDGSPTNPRAWLITVAARRLTDLLRSEQSRRQREDTARTWALPDEWLAPAADRSWAGGADPDHDDSLILLFMCCHPRCRRLADCPDAARRRRSEHGGNRPGVHGPGSHHDQADQPSQATRQGQ